MRLRGYHRFRRAGLAGCILLSSVFASGARADDWRDGGLKRLNDRLAEWGIVLNATYIGETLGNASGGVRRGAVYEGRLDVGTDIDLDKAVGWSGAVLHANFFQIHGQGLSRYYVNNLMTVDTLMWGSDYPHTDGIWPESTKYIEEQFRGLSQEDIRKITCDNAAKFYNLTN